MQRYRFNARADMDDSWPSYTMAEIDAMVASVMSPRRRAEEHLDAAVARERAIRREVAEGMEIDRRVAERLPGERLDAVYKRMRGAS